MPARRRRMARPGTLPFLHRALGHNRAAIPAFPPLQVIARRAVRLGAGWAMSRTRFARGNLFRIVAVRASDDLCTVAVGPGQGSATAVLPTAALGAGGRKGHGYAFRCQAVREHTGRIGRLPGRERAQGSAQVTGAPPGWSGQAIALWRSITRHALRHPTAAVPRPEAGLRFRASRSCSIVPARHSARHDRAPREWPRQHRPAPINAHANRAPRANHGHCVSRASGAPRACPDS